MTPAGALAAIPSGLRDPLLEEYRQITQNYSEHRWSPSELSGGRFCEIVYTILSGYAAKKYATQPSKPRDFVSACRALEANAAVPRSFQILIPRMLPALYEVRNNRGVGHVGGDVNPNHMDATLVLSMCNWVMAELVRVFHSLSTEKAQNVVDSLAERRLPLVWQKGDLKRVLDPKISLNDQVLLLIASSAEPVDADELLRWTDYGNQAYFKKLIASLHNARMLNRSSDGKQVEILPPGSKYLSEFIAKRAGSLL